MRVSYLSWTPLLLVLIGGCEIEARETPTLCIEPVAADGCSNPGETDAGPVGLIRAGEAFRIVHTMPEGIEVDRDVEISIQTPCHTEVESHRHVDGVVEMVRIAPPGAECALAVDAVILNSELRASTPGGECADVDQVCEDADDGGGDS